MDLEAEGAVVEPSVVGKFDVGAVEEEPWCL